MLPVPYGLLAHELIEVVDTACLTCPGPNAIDVDSYGQPHIAYEDYGMIWYRYRGTDGSWSQYESLTGLNNNAVLRADLGFDGKVDSGNNYQIGYVAEYSGGQGILFMYKDSDGICAMLILAPYCRCINMNEN